MMLRVLELICFSPQKYQQCQKEQDTSIPQGLDQSYQFEDIGQNKLANVLISKFNCKENQFHEEK